MKINIIFAFLIVLLPAVAAETRMESLRDDWSYSNDDSNRYNLYYPSEVAINTEAPTIYATWTSDESSSWVALGGTPTFTWTPTIRNGSCSLTGSPTTNTVSTGAGITSRFQQTVVMGITAPIYCSGDVRVQMSIGGTTFDDRILPFYITVRQTTINTVVSGELDAKNRICANSDFGEACDQLEIAAHVDGTLDTQTRVCASSSFTTPCTTPTINLGGSINAAISGGLTLSGSMSNSISGSLTLGGSVNIGSIGGTVNLGGNLGIRNSAGTTFAIGGILGICNEEITFNELGDPVCPTLHVAIDGVSLNANVTGVELVIPDTFHLCGDKAKGDCAPLSNELSSYLLTPGNLMLLFVIGLIILGETRRDFIYKTIAGLLLIVCAWVFIDDIFPGLREANFGLLVALRVILFMLGVYLGLHFLFGREDSNIGKKLRRS